MKNPNGPYPGRQLFLGRTTAGNPAFVYIVTGRSPASRERRAAPRDNSIIMGPIAGEAYDWLRHYTAVKYDNDIGLLTVTNGIQTEAIYEFYRLLCHTAANPAKGYLKKVMDGANYEPDSLETPRISGVVAHRLGKPEPVYLISIKTARKPAFVWQIAPVPGQLAGISTYHGEMENPGAYRAADGPVAITLEATKPQTLAETAYEMTKAEYKGDDIRVCAVAGVRGDDNHTWELAHINRHQE